MESFKEIIDDGTIIYKNKEGELHRIDGPALEWISGNNSWWVNDVELSEDEFLKWQLKNFKTVKLNFQ